MILVFILELKLNLKIAVNFNKLLRERHQVHHSMMVFPSASSNRLKRQARQVHLSKKLKFRQTKYRILHDFIQKEIQYSNVKLHSKNVNSLKAKNPINSKYPYMNVSNK